MGKTELKHTLPLLKLGIPSERKSTQTTPFLNSSLKPVSGETAHVRYITHNKGNRLNITLCYFFVKQHKFEA